jgi:hypothetical protein
LSIAEDDKTANLLTAAISWVKQTPPYNLARSIRRGGPKAHRTPARWLRRPHIAAGSRVCIFVLLARGGRLMPHSVGHARAWHDAGFDVVAVIIVDSLAVAVDTGTLDFASAVLLRENKGYDFGAWAAAIKMLGRPVRNYSLLATANDSVLGPANTFRQMIDRVDAMNADLIGLTESNEITYHYQSYLLFFKPLALRSRIFRHFWNNVRTGDRSYVIDNYELKLYGEFAESGLRTDLLYSLKGLPTFNPTLDAWRDLFEIGFPYLKVQLLRVNQLESSLNGWLALAEEHGFNAAQLQSHIAELRSTDASRWASDSYTAYGDR